MARSHRSRLERARAAAERARAAAAAIGAIVGLLLGLVREYFQNVGDEPDEDTLFTIGDLPVNKNMLWDITFYAIGALLGSLAVANQYLEQAAV